MRQKELNFKQARWALKLIVYNFEIFHRSKIKNSTNESSRRSNYEKISSLNIKLLSTLQNKLALSSNEKSLTQSERKILNALILKSNILIDVAIVDERTLSRNKRELLEDLVSMFQLVEVQIVISRKKIRDMSKKFYEKSQRSMKFLIKNLQARNDLTKELCAQVSSPRRSRKKRSKTWFVDFEELVRHNERLYILDDEVVREEIVSKNHDDSLIEHFDVEKTLKLIQRKYFWLDCAKQTIAYVQTCDVCQRIKASRHKSYDELTSLSISKKSWKKIIMNFVIDLSSSKRKEVVYDSILIVVNRYIKMTKYIFVIVKIDVVALTKMFFEEIVLRFDFFNDIVSDKEFVFINVFWSTICYHAKIKRRLSIVFHSQTNELIERQNQILKHYLWTFVDVEQTRWANLLSLTKFATNNTQNAFIEVSFYYACYDYHLEINYEIENNLIERKISIAKERVKTLHELKKSLMQRLKHASVKQARYYNKKYQSTFFKIEDLVMFSTKNLK